jgi:hypothetical protein
MRHLLRVVFEFQHSATIERGAYAVTIVALSTIALLLADGIMRGASNNAHVVTELARSSGGAPRWGQGDRTERQDPAYASVDGREQRVLSALETTAARATTALTDPLASLSGGRASAARIGDSEDMRSNWYRGSGGTFTTVCVRLCDGWYRPVSFSTTEDNFERDSVACQSSCGSPARLFVYRNPGENVQQMADLRGQAYVRLKTAFLFQSTYTPSCTCRPQPWDAQAAERHRIYGLQASAAKGNAAAKRELKNLGSSRVAALTEPTPGAVVDRIELGAYRQSTSRSRSSSTKTMAKASMQPADRSKPNRSASWSTKAFESSR